MDPKIVKMAKEIPSKLKEVMNSMFEASEPALRSGVSGLRQSLSKLDSYLADVEKEHLGSGGKHDSEGNQGEASTRSWQARTLRHHRVRA